MLGSRSTRGEKQEKDSRDAAWAGPRYEYKVLNVAAVPAGTLERKLDEYGLAGWEGFATRDNMVLLKRLRP